MCPLTCVNFREEEIVLRPRYQDQHKIPTPAVVVRAGGGPRRAVRARGYAERGRYCG